MRDIYDFKGKRALITGSTSGIGYAIALRLASGGAEIVLNYRDDDTRAGEAVREIQGMGAKCAGIRADVSSADECRRLAREAIFEMNGLDFLILNAGPFEMSPLADMPPERWSYIVDANFSSAFHIAQECIPSLRKSRGCIVVIGGVNSGSFVVKANSSAYHSSKAALAVLMRTIAVEEGRHGIRANMLCPGFIDTGDYSESFRRKAVDEIPLGRFGAPDDVAAPAVWLLTDDARYVTGSIIDAGGGLWM